MKSASICLGFVLIALGACSSGQAPTADNGNRLSSGDSTDADGGSTPDAGTNAVPLGQVGAATDGTQALFIWTGGTQAGVHGARVAEDGTILGSVTLPSAAASGQNVAAAGYDGEKFLVTWLNEPSGSSSLSVHGARVSKQGEALESQPLVLGSAGSGLLDDLDIGMRIAVAGGAGIFEVGWIAGGSFVNARVDGCGAVGPATVYAPPSGIMEQFPAAISFNGSLTTLCAFNGLLSWPGGPPGTPDVRVGDCHSYPAYGNPNQGWTNSSVPALAYGGNTLAQAWSYQDKIFATPDVQGRIGEHPFSLGSSARDVEVGFDGTYFHVVWLTNDYKDATLMEQRVGIDGSPIDSPVILEPATSHLADGISVACPGTTCMVGFHDDAGIGVIRLAGAAPGATGRIALAAAP